MKMFYKLYIILKRENILIIVIFVIFQEYLGVDSQNFIWKKIIKMAPI